MKRTQHIINNALTEEGQHTLLIKEIAQANKEIIGNKVIITGTLETGKTERIFLNADLVGNQSESFYDTAMFALADQLDKLPISNEDFDTADVALMNTLFKDKSFTCYCVHSTSTDGKTYANIHFEKNNIVKAMLATL